MGVTSKKNSVLLCAQLVGIALLVAVIIHAWRGIRQVDEQLEQNDEQLEKVNERLENRKAATARAQQQSAKAQATMSAHNGPILVRLANRTIEIEASSPFPKTFAQHQTSSARGTLPYLVVCAEPVSKTTREQAAACGARVLGVVSASVLLVETDEASLAKLASTKDFSAACELMPLDKVSVDLASADGEVDVTLVPLAEADVGAVSNAVIAAGGSVLATPAGRVRAHILARQVSELAARGDVQLIERFTPAQLLNDVVVNPGLLNVRKAWAAPHGLTGAGQIITVADSGLDTGSTNTVMADFQGRVNLIRTVPGYNCYTCDIHGHGTHVAGSLAGNGALSGGTIRGVAYAATLNVWQGLASDGLYTPDSLDDMFRPDQTNYPTYIFSGSWGLENDGTYSDLCHQYDDWIWRHPDTLAVLACGNKNNQRVSAPGSAKNVVAAGASESLRPGSSLSSYADNPAEVSYYSSPGPTQDGRIKPDLCAPGTMILSTLSTQASDADLGWGTYSANTHYTYDGGTSMATPLVAGCAALVRQWLVERRGFAGTPPTAALMKAILTGGAHDLFGDVGTNVRQTAPNGQEGWGRVDLGETLYPSNRSVRLVDRIPFATRSEQVWHVETMRAAPLDVQLVWIDYPATSQGGGGLINDLDLVVSNRMTGAVWWGNGVAGGDRTNNVEGVRIASAPAGTYDVYVRGVTVPYDSTEGGAAALYMRGAFRRGLAAVFR